MTGDAAPASVTVRAHAKINLTLDVLGQRPDGYHEIESIMQTISLADDITVTRTARPGVSITVDGPYAAGAPTDHTNLAVKAANALLAAADATDIGLTIALSKSIPSQAGLGGGSSDAAAVLNAVNRLLRSPLDRDALVPLAAKLGADVPFFLTGGAARVTGIGDRIEAIGAGFTGSLVLVKPPVGVSTAAAYSALDELPGRQSANATRSWPSGGFANDFEAVIYTLAPEIAAARDALLAAGATTTLLCGSGATVAGFGPNAAALAISVREYGVGDVWVVETSA
ncbi:MAG TPA: 4-(cytidine 5'-diphospho)-2-C-methyl-D-erythritol kinase [Capsulimonadaceae bacterium]|jgi:4-diphosphocytidyl-2-C-methyl-D-erythritol kinase